MTGSGVMAVVRVAVADSVVPCNLFENGAVGFVVRAGTMPFKRLSRPVRATRCGDTNLKWSRTPHPIATNVIQMLNTFEFILHLDSLFPVIEIIAAGSIMSVWRERCVGESEAATWTRRFLLDTSRWTERPEYLLMSYRVAQVLAGHERFCLVYLHRTKRAPNYERDQYRHPYVDVEHTVQLPMPRWPFRQSLRTVG